MILFPTLASSDILIITSITRSATMTMSSLSPRQERQQNTATKKNKKSIATTTNKTIVRFHNIVAVKETLHLNNYTEQEIKACWLTQEEKKLTKRRIFMALQRMKSSSCNLFNNSNNEDDINIDVSSSLSSSTSLLFSSPYCMRGLENYLWTKSIKLQHQNAVCAVLDEQNRQYKNAKLILSNQLQQKEKMMQQQQQNHIHNDVGNLLAEDREKTSNIFAIDDNKVRDVYRKYTQISEAIAYTMGRIDASSVILMDKEDNNNRRKTMKRNREWTTNNNNDTNKMMKTINHSHYKILITAALGA